jgi:hypothetical protein
MDSAGKLILESIFRSIRAWPTTKGTREPLTPVSHVALQTPIRGGFGPDRQWFLFPLGSTIYGTINVYAEDRITQIGTGKITIAGGKAYRLVLRL